MNSGDWIEDINQAHDFETGGNAVDFVVKEKLKDVEVIYSFPEPRYDFILVKL